MVFEAYPNRDSVPYKELYGFKDAQKVLRGTLRYVGYSVLMSAFRNLGMATDEPVPLSFT